MRRRDFIATSLAFAVTATSARGSRAAAVDLLVAGQAVVYFRHAATTWSGIDQIEWPRSRQRLLSELGIEQSRLIGRAFSTLGFPVGEVIASPFARCRDMAEIAFGRVEENMLLLGLLSDRDGRQERSAFLRDRLTAPTLDMKNRVIVSHRSDIADVAGVELAEGEGVVIQPNTGNFQVLAQLMPQDWTTL